MQGKRSRSRWFVLLILAGVGLGALLLSRWQPLARAGDTGGDPTPWVEIRTGGTLEILQEQPGEIAIVAEIVPKENTIGWEITGPGADFVQETHSQIGNVSTATISLKRPILPAWTADSSITVKAYDTSNSSIQDQKDVSLKKFKRNGQCSPGSNPVAVSLPKDGSGIGFTFTGSGGCPALSAWIVAFLLADGGTGILAPSDSAPPLGTTTNLTYYYQSQNDKCDGTYSLREAVNFIGSLAVNGAYSGIIDNTEMAVASGVGGGVDNDAANLSVNRLGYEHSGPDSVTLGITASGGSAGGEAGGGISVTLSHVGAEQFSVSQASTGPYIVEASGNHLAGHQISVEKLVQVGAGGWVQQLYDDDWTIVTGAQMTASVSNPNAIKITFEPNI